MYTDTLKFGQLRRLDAADDIPYELLLLADESIDSIKHYIHESLIYVLEKEENLLAVFVLQEVTNTCVEIKNIAVDQTHQGKGIGKYLLSEATSIAHEMGYEHLLIGTGNSSIMQLYLYQKEGFEIVAVRKDYFTDNYPKPIYENGIQCKHMIVLQKTL